MAWGRISRNPATAAKPPSASQTNSGPPNTWTGTQLRQFLELCHGCQDRYYPAWVLLASTGARRGEVLGLRWTDLDLEAGRMKVVQQLCLVGHEVRIEQPKTHRSQRPISLDPSTVAVLRRWKADQAAERLLMGAGYRDLGLVNCHPDGHPYDPSRFSREFKRRIERWELSPLSVHGLRHTWATLALEAGVHPKVVQERLGHSTIAITLGTYSHVMPGMDAAAAALVAGEFLP